MCLFEDIPFIIFNSILVFVHKANEQAIVISLLLNCVMLGIKGKDIILMKLSKE
jgi:hypothetical protein